jgi:methylglutaconyl-CoA hydratase
MRNNSIIYQEDSRGVATITLHRPHLHNAFDQAMIEALLEKLQEINNNSTISVVLLNAMGKNFSAGADINWMQQMVDYSEEENYFDSLKLANLMQTLNTLRQPTIALVQGAAYGGGVGLVACCDIAIATTNATFCFSEVKIGLIPAVISPYIINAIGQKAARRYFLTGEQFTAPTAQSLGLIDTIAEEAELLKTAEAFILRLLDNSQPALQAAKKLVIDMVNQPIGSALIQETARRIAKIRVSESGQVRLKAFLAKRK